jgi:hypothetical protein
VVQTGSQAMHAMHEGLDTTRTASVRVSLLVPMLMPPHATPRPARFGYGCPIRCLAFRPIQKSRVKSQPHPASHGPHSIPPTLNLSSISPPRLASHLHLNTSQSSVYRELSYSGSATPGLRRDEQNAQIYHPGM